MTTRSVGTHEPAVRLVYGNPHGFVAHGTIPKLETGQPYSFGGILLCTWPAGVIEITGVRMLGGSGDTPVIAFATRPNPNAKGQPGMGDATEPLDRLGFEPSRPATVGTACPADMTAEEHLDLLEPRDLTEFAVQIERPSANTTTFDGLLIDNTHESVRGTEIAQFGITLCGEDDRTAGVCGT